MDDNGRFLLGDRLMDMKVAEVRREMDGYRLQRQASGPCARGARFYCAAAVGLGERLVRWGARLQEHCGADVSSPEAARVR